MPLLEKQLFIKKSGIPGAGKGLFTKQYIAKGTRIAEYKGRITTWKNVLQLEAKTGIVNRYLFYVTRDYVIDAMRTIKTVSRYANDARGLSKIKGLNNNCNYVKNGKRVFIEAIKPIQANAEILVGYGKEYWDVIKKESKQS